MVQHFVNMAKGNATPGMHAIPRGLGIATRPATYRIIPRPVIKAVTPMAQAVRQAKASIKSQDGETKSIRRQSAKKRKTGSYQMPGLD